MLGPLLHHGDRDSLLAGERSLQHGVDSVYWVNLPSGIGASGGSMTIYIGFASTAANLFSATGYTGETATQGPSYGIYDNGAIVFNLYDNFAGTTLEQPVGPLILNDGQRRDGHRGDGSGKHDDRLSERGCLYDHAV